MAGSAIVISILADARQANASLNQTVTTTQRLGNGFRKMAAPAAAGLGLLVAGGLKAAHAAAEDAKSQTILASALRNSTGANDKQVASMEKFVDKTSRAVGVADDQLRPALGALVRATGSATTSQAALSQALDISAATGKDVGAVSNALAKGYGGNTTALGKLVPGLDKAILKSGDMTKITAELARMTGGTAAKAAKTEAGQRARATVAMDEAVETIGARLLPVYAKAAKAGAAAANWLAKNERTAYILVGAMAALAAIVIAVNVAMKLAAAATAIYNGVMAICLAASKAATAASLGTRLGLAALTAQTIITSAASKAMAAAQWLLNAALSANPIALVVLAIAALVAGLIFAYQHSETFRNIVNSVFGFIAKFVPQVVGAVVGFVRDHWKLLLSIITGPIGAAVIFVVSHFGDIKNAAGSLYTGVKDKVGSLFTFISELPGKIVTKLGDLKDDLVGAGEDLVRGLITGIGNMAQAAVDKVKGVVGGAIKGAKNLLGIHSPSTVFRDIGRNTMQGLLDGIGSKSGAVQQTVRSLASRLADTKLTLGGVSLGADGSGVIDVVGRGGNTYNTFHVAVTVEAGMSKAEMGRKIWEALLEAMGLGLVPAL